MSGAGWSAARRWTGATLSTLALVCVAAVALVMIVIPLAMKATPFTVLTASMLPTMPPGTLVVTRPTPPDDITIGDVVTYQLRSNEPDVVTHRVVGLGWDSAGERSFITRGDANTVDDEPVRAVQVRGTVAYAVPYLGYVNTWVGINRPGWLLKTVAAALIGYGLVLVLSGVRDRRRRIVATDTDEPDSEPTTELDPATDSVSTADGEPAIEPEPTTGPGPEVEVEPEAGPQPTTRSTATPKPRATTKPGATTKPTAKSTAKPRTTTKSTAKPRTMTKPTALAPTAEATTAGRPNPRAERLGSSAELAATSQASS